MDKGMPYDHGCGGVFCLVLHTGYFVHAWEEPHVSQDAVQKIL